MRTANIAGDIYNLRSLRYLFDMRYLNRSVIIIRPKGPFIKWANGCSMDSRKYSGKYFADQTIAALIPFYDAVTVRDVRKHVDIVWPNIFEEELRRWNPDELWWPKDRTRKMFGLWFKVEFHSIVIDTILPEPVKTVL